MEFFFGGRRLDRKTLGGASRSSVQMHQVVGMEDGRGPCLSLLPWSSPSPGRHRRARGTDRTNADTLGEAVIGHNVLVQSLDSPLPQAGAVVALVQVAQG